MYIILGEFVSEEHVKNFDMLVLIHFVDNEARRARLLRELGELKPNAKIVLVNAKSGDDRCATWQQIVAEHFPGFGVTVVPESVAVDAGDSWQDMKPKIVQWLLDHGLLHNWCGCC